MKTLKNQTQNPQKQRQVNILGYFDGPKLYKRSIENTFLHSSRQKNNRKSPIQIQRNQKDNQIKNIKPPLTTRNSYLSQRNKYFQGSQNSGFSTARKSNDPQGNKNNQEKSSIRTASLLKKQINFNQRKRFYYKEEYDSNDEACYQHQQLSQKSQYKTILPNYFNKINGRSPKISQFDSQVRNQNKQKRSLSPLEESQQQLFAKCYKETSNHLELMLKEISQSRQKLNQIHEEILESVYETVKKRSTSLRCQLIEMVEEILDEWEENEWQFIKKNEILYLDDLLELKQQLNERELKVNLLIERLEKQKSLSWVQDLSQRLSSQISQKVSTAWKNVTTDLLMFNYEHSIMEIQQLSNKIATSIPQKCIKAINILPSSQFHKNPYKKIENKPAFIDLKNTILNVIPQIYHCFQINPSQNTLAKQYNQDHRLSYLPREKFIVNNRF